MISPNSPNRDRIETSPQPSQICSKTISQSASSSQSRSEVKSVRSTCSPWLAALAYPIARYVLLPLYFQQIEVSGRENFPQTGPVILAPTHRSRWDAFMVPYAVGQDVTGRMLRFMVTADEVKGLQGWFIQRLGGFAIDTRHPAIATLRHSVELLQQGEALVIFPEGNVFRECRPLKPGLARLALQAEASQPDLGIQIVPITIQYSKPLVPWRCAVKIRVHPPMAVTEYGLDNSKQKAKRLTRDLERVFRSACGFLRQKIDKP
nr:1-acyl-sn-glycerol-3-phosphate acyltransferase [Myxacorys almedinensis]